MYSEEIVPAFRQAIMRAENNPRNHGVLSVPTSSASEAQGVLDNSIYNNLVRWHEAGRPGKFVDFMQQRWAPIGVSNDPNNLNRNWAPNVRKFLQQQDPQQYDEMKANGLVLRQPPLEAFTV